MHTSFRFFGIGAAFVAISFSTVGQWHRPAEYARAEDFHDFIDVCRQDRNWGSASVLVRLGDKTHRIVASQESESGDVYFHRNGDMRWVTTLSSPFENLSMSRVEGYNGGSADLVSSGQLHSIGGYGLWRSHFNMLRFEGGARAWELLGVNGEAPAERNLDQSIMHAQRDEVFVLADLNNGTGQYGDVKYALYRLDLPTRSWSFLGDVDARLGQINGSLSFGRGWMLTNTAGELIWVDFESMQAQLMGKEAKTLRAFSTWNQQAGRMTFVSDSVVLHRFGDQERRLDMNDLDWSKASVVGLLDHSTAEQDMAGLVQPVPENSDSFNGERRWLPWLLVVLLTLGWGLTVARRSSNPFSMSEGRLDDKMNQSPSRLSAQTEELRKRRGEQFETEELDEILGIAHLASPETLRSQRARLIARINTEHRIMFGHDLIVRKQSPEDRRRSRYIFSGGED